MGYNDTAAERGRLQRRLRDLQDVLDGLHDNLTRERRQNQSTASTEREIGRITTEISGLEREISGLR